MLLCAMFSIITLLNFNSLHLPRKGRLKLIVVRIWFQNGQTSRMVDYHCPSASTIGVDMDNYYTESTQLQYTVNTEYLISYYIKS